MYLKKKWLNRVLLSQSVRSADRPIYASHAILILLVHLILFEALTFFNSWFRYNLDKMLSVRLQFNGLTFVQHKGTVCTRLLHLQGRLFSLVLVLNVVISGRVTELVRFIC